MSVNGRAEGPTLTDVTADLGVLVRVLGATLNQGLSGYIVGGENSSTVAIEFDNGSVHNYPVDRLQLYMPQGAVVRKRVVKKRTPVIPSIRRPTQPPQSSNPTRLPGGGVQQAKNFVQPRGQPTESPYSALRRREPRETVKSKEAEPAEKKLFRKSADWNF